MPPPPQILYATADKWCCCEYVCVTPNRVATSFVVCRNEASRDLRARDGDNFLINKVSDRTLVAAAAAAGLDFVFISRMIAFQPGPKSFL